MKNYLIVLFIGLFFSAFSQSDSDLQLAQHYYGQGSYEKALEYYEKIYNDAPSLVIFKKYFENREQVTIELQNGVDIKASDYFDIPKNTFVLSGLNSALDRAKEECLKIVEENDRIKSGLTKIKNEN